MADFLKIYQNKDWKLVLIDMSPQYMTFIQEKNLVVKKSFFWLFLANFWLILSVLEFRTGDAVIILE